MRLSTDMSTTITALLAIACYAAAGIIITIRLFRERGGKKPPRASGIGLGLTGVILHTVVLYQNIHLDSGINLASLRLISGDVDYSATAHDFIPDQTGRKPRHCTTPYRSNLRRSGAVHTNDQAAAGRCILGLTDTCPNLTLSLQHFAMASVQAILLSIQDHHLRNRHPGGFIRALPHCKLWKHY